jgi:hypothetical protein
MIVTEKEAQGILCCGPPCIAMEMARAVDSFCLGSRCMAWRWSTTAPVPNPGGTEGTGYCGLAGNPRGVS